MPSPSSTNFYDEWFEDFEVTRVDRRVWNESELARESEYLVDDSLCQIVPDTPITDIIYPEFVRDNFIE